MNTQKLDRLIEEAANSPALVAYLKASFAGADLPDSLLKEAEESPYQLKMPVPLLSGAD